MRQASWLTRTTGINALTSYSSRKFRRLVYTRGAGDRYLLHQQSELHQQVRGLQALLRKPLTETVHGLLDAVY